jgi:hypothetical protein
VFQALSVECVKARADLAPIDAAIRAAAVGGEYDLKEFVATMRALYAAALCWRRAQGADRPSLAEQIVAAHRRAAPEWALTALGALLDITCAREGDDHSMTTMTDVALPNSADGMSTKWTVVYTAGGMVTLQIQNRPPNVNARIRVNGSSGTTGDALTSPCCSPCKFCLCRSPAATSCWVHQMAPVPAPCRR